ncbi:MAG: hypothetical protein AAGM16_06110 [Pseudomonadota bacterium]
MRLIAILVLASLTVGCLSPLSIAAKPAKGDSFSGVIEIPDGKAVLYVIREKRFFQSGTYPKISMCGNEPVALRNGGHFVAVVDPGDCDIVFTKGLWWTMSTEDITVELTPDTQYFLSFLIESTEISATPTMNGPAWYVAGNAAFVPVSEEAGLKLLSETRESF